MPSTKYKNNKRRQKGRAKNNTDRSVHQAGRARISSIMAATKKVHQGVHPSEVFFPHHPSFDGDAGLDPQVVDAVDALVLNVDSVKEIEQMGQEEFDRIKEYSKKKKQGFAKIAALDGWKLDGNKNTPTDWTREAI